MFLKFLIKKFSEFSWGPWLSEFYTLNLYTLSFLRSRTLWELVFYMIFFIIYLLFSFYSEFLKFIPVIVHSLTILEVAVIYLQLEFAQECYFLLYKREPIPKGLIKDNVLGLDPSTAMQLLLCWYIFHALLTSLTIGSSLLRAEVILFYYLI